MLLIIHENECIWCGFPIPFLFWHEQEFWSCSSHLAILMDQQWKKNVKNIVRASPENVVLLNKYSQLLSKDFLLFKEISSTCLNHYKWSFQYVHLTETSEKINVNSHTRKVIGKNHMCSVAKKWLFFPGSLTWRVAFKQAWEKLSALGSCILGLRTICSWSVPSIKISSLISLFKATFFLFFRNRDCKVIKRVP